MTFKEKIQTLRKGASEAQSATKIIDKLKALKDSNGLNSSYRWIWELIQNAKDVVNKSGLVDIEINFSESSKTLEFCHNGRLFTTENIVFLIEQVSTKERSLTAENKKKLTGKFGTGFLTTHLLSEKVQIHGYLQDEGETPRSFQTLLDRTGQDKTSIMNAISNSCDMLDNGTECTVDDGEMNTKFVYELDNLGIETAKLGLKSLLISVPYVFAFVPELNSITVNIDTYKRVIRRGKKVSVELDSTNVTEVQISTVRAGKSTEGNRYVFVVSNDSVSTAVEIRIDANEKHLIKPHDDLPRIFCDFPLLGTDDFSFPVVVNSPLFNPTEPRDGIPLIQSERSSSDSEENRNRITEAISLYNAMIDYFAKKNYKEIYNIVKIPKQTEKYWLDVQWVEQNLIDPIKEYISTTAFIENSTGEFCSLYDDWGTPTIFIMKDEMSELRNAVWELSSKLLPNLITQKIEVENWYKSLWEECRNYGVLDLIKRVENFQNMNTLEEQLGCDGFSWLNKLIELFYSNPSVFIADLGRNPSILPNQHGEFMSFDDIYIENNIGETYKDIAAIADIDFRKRLLDSRVNITHLKNLRDLSLKNVFSELIQAHMDDDTKAELYKSIINLRGNRNEKQDAFIAIAKQIYPDFFGKTIKVFSTSDKLLSDALKFWRGKICDDISSCKTVKVVAKQYGFQNDNDIAEWIASLIKHLKLCDDESLLDKYAVLPNQYGVFKRKSELFLDDGSVDKILKDAARYSGDDVKERMLYRKIPLDLPSNRVISLETVAPTITSYVRNNYKFISKQPIETKETFRNTSIWIRDNRKNSNVGKCFKELLENIHWFYDDEEIAENMAKSEQYDEIMKKYNVANINELSIILASHSAGNTVDSGTISISKEFLAQWGITSEEELEKALSKNVFGSSQIHRSANSAELFSYVKNILDRAKSNIVNFLYSHEDYEFDKDNLQFIANTIFRVRKLGQEIYIIARPSDFEQIILYYDTEIDLLDFDKDCELWVEDGINPTPQKITLGRILKVTGVNKIPLRSIRQ